MLTPAHLNVLRQLADTAKATNSDVGMDASVLSALLDLVSPPADFPVAASEAAAEHTVRCYARIHRLTRERDEARDALMHYTHATAVRSWGMQELADDGAVARQALGLPEHAPWCDWPNCGCTCGWPDVQQAPPASEGGA